ncbi:MAG: thioredoxin fold domain-containing protein [Saprospiraceae bacterium]|nr:thioredoxin fold domain-containing protein [Saprospiraceae bacterium]
MVKRFFTSFPPTIALSVFKTHFPEQSVAFASRLQKAIYYDGIEPANLSEYGKLAAEFGLDASHFIAEMQMEKFAKLAQSEFVLSQQLGVTGFPTVFLMDDSKIIPIARGYVAFERLEHQFFQAKSILSQ